MSPRKKLFNSPNKRESNQGTLGFSVIATPAQSGPSSGSTSPAPSTSETPKRPRRPLLEKDLSVCPTPRKKSRRNVPVSEQNGEHDSSTDEDEDVTDTAFPREAIQQMSIHRIVNSRQVSTWGCSTLNSATQGCKREEKFIEKIISAYNEQQKKDNNKSHENIFLFEEQKPRKDIDLSSSAKELMVGTEFENRLYVQETFATNNLLRWYGVGSKIQSCNVHMVWFLYRPGEIYALTTNQAWNVVHNYSDFEFSGKIAARICSEQGAKYTDDKVLIGNLLQNAKLMKDGLSPSTNDAPVLCSSFTATLKDTASILKFPCFEKERVQTSRASITFGFGCLRFKKRFKVSDFPLILDHLAIIARGGPTEKYLRVSSDGSTDSRSNTIANLPDDEVESSSAQSSTHSTTGSTYSASDVESDDNNALCTTRDSGFEATPLSGEKAQFSGHHPPPHSLDMEINDNHGAEPESEPEATGSGNINSQLWSQDSTIDSIEETETDVYQRNFTRLPKELNATLDEELARVLGEVIKCKRPGGTNNFELSYRYTKDFALASSLSLTFKNTVIQLPVNSTLSDILNELLRSGDNEIQKLQNFDYTNRKKLKDEWKQVKIVYTLPNGKSETDNLFNFMEGELIYGKQIYWRVMRQWCQVNKDYLMNTHFWFQGFLKKYLILEQDQKLLPIKWPSEAVRKGLLEQNSNIDFISYYTNLYKDQPNFFEPPPKTSDSHPMPLFDLLHLDRESDRIMIYFFSSNFTFDTSKLCRRIFRCQEEIQRALRLLNPSGLFKREKYFYKNLVKRGVFSKENYSDFANMLRTCTIVYALPNVQRTEVDRIRQGPMDMHLCGAAENSTGRLAKCSLMDEKEILFTVTQKDIQKCLRNACDSKVITNEDLLLLMPNKKKPLDDSALLVGATKRIFEELLDLKYITQTQEPNNMITEKFVYSTESEFWLKSISCSSTASREEKQKKTELRSKLYHVVLSKFRTKYTSLRAKLELREIANNRNHRETEFKLYEVQVDEDSVQVPV